jgi:hypothetical protein
MTTTNKPSEGSRHASILGRGLLALSLLVGTPSPVRLSANNLAAEAALSPEAAASATEKLRQIQDGSLAQNSAPIRMSEAEANSYLLYELGPKYPAGLNSVEMRFTPGRLAGTAQVDFDKAKAASRHRDNPLMDFLFWGTHTLGVEGGFSAISGVGHFDLEKVSLDGVTLPQPMVDYLIERFLKDRLPDLALDRPFPLPYSIDRVQVERGSILVAGRSESRLVAIGH